MVAGHGIDHFIDLTESGELEPYAGIVAKEARRLGLDIGWERHPIAPSTSPPPAPKHPLLFPFLPRTDGQDVRHHSMPSTPRVRDDRTVYVHCWGGVGRTGTTVGCWLVRHGHTGKEALRRIAEWWQGMEKIYFHPRSPETNEQREYVRSWAEPSAGPRPGSADQTR